MTKLSVNLNKIATLRNTRSLDIPSVTRCATICINAGAAGITIHPRPDQRHIRTTDIYALADLLKKHPAIELNIEGNPFYPFVEYARDVRPSQCTLVPDSPEAGTSDHGWDLENDAKRLAPVIETLKSYGCRVSLFMNPLPEMMRRAKDLGADRVELYTEPYARAFAANDRHAVDAYRAAAQAASENDLGVNAGHDLNLRNLTHFIREVPQTLEVSIGHALIADAMEFGLDLSVKKYLTEIEIAQP